MLRGHLVAGPALGEEATSHLPAQRPRAGEQEGLLFTPARRWASPAAEARGGWRREGGGWEEGEDQNKVTVQAPDLSGNISGVATEEKPALSKTTELKNRNFLYPVC